MGRAHFLPRRCEPNLPGWGKPIDRNPATAAIAGSEGALFQLHGDDKTIYKWDGLSVCPDDLSQTCLGWGRPIDRNPATVAITAVQLSDLPPPPPSLTPEQTAILNAHNTFRRKHCVAGFQWSAELATNAQTWANGCHKDTHGNFCHQNACGTPTPFGENLGFGFRLSNGQPILPGLTPEEAVSNWYCEIQNYNFDQPALKSGSVSKACMPPVNGHFTQVVWKETTLIGCASSTCPDATGKLGTLWVCEYSPPGNNSQTLNQNVLRPTCQ
jgi:pathogenesis-related protein 1